LHNNEVSFNSFAFSSILCWILFFWHVDITYLSLSISKISLVFQKIKNSCQTKRFWSSEVFTRTHQTYSIIIISICNGNFICSKC
jgi:hypothetical protein